MLLPAGHVGESNPRLTVPNGACYRYTNAAVLKGRGDWPDLRNGSTDWYGVPGKF